MTRLKQGRWLGEERREAAKGVVGSVERRLLRAPPRSLSKRRIRFLTFASRGKLRKSADSLTSTLCEEPSEVARCRNISGKAGPGQPRYLPYGPVARLLACHFQAAPDRCMCDHETVQEEQDKRPFGGQTTIMKIRRLQPAGTRFGTSAPPRRGSPASPLRGR